MNIRVLVATGGPASALAAKEATQQVPVVFTGPTDPVGLGLVRSLNQPGANVTGIAGLTTKLDAKRLELLRELVPPATVIAALVNSSKPNVAVQMSELQKIGSAIRQEIVVLKVTSEHDFDSALAKKDEHGIRAVARIFAGTLPRDLPVETVHQQALAINLKTAKAIGLEIPPLLLTRADEVIE